MSVGNELLRHVASRSLPGSGGGKVSLFLPSISESTKAKRAGCASLSSEPLMARRSIV